jgi:hypothetical protein
MKTACPGRNSPMRKEAVDLIHEAMKQHEHSRSFYHRLAHQVSHAETREMFGYLAKKAEENKDRLHQCLTPECCPVVPPAHDLHLAEHLKLPKVMEGLSPKEAIEMAIKRSVRTRKVLSIAARTPTGGRDPAPPGIPGQCGVRPQGKAGKYLRYGSLPGGMVIPG